jgi:hypothetical protein
MSGFYLLVEGLLDEAVGRSLIHHTGGRVDAAFGKRGWTWIRENIDGFNGMAEEIPHLVIVDLMDTNFDCPVPVRDDWIPDPSDKLLFRLAVREVESWLLADRANIARFLGRPKREIPQSPEQIEDPKRRLINLARDSRYEQITRKLVPSDPTATEGRAYTSEMRKFVRKRWDPQVAAESAPSLRRCISALRELTAKL